MREFENEEEDYCSESVYDYEMGWFAFLPSEIIVLNILSRLHIKGVMRCRCVCKAWHRLLSTSEFVESHVSKAGPGLLLFERKMHPGPYQYLEFVQQDDLHPNPNPNPNLLLWYGRGRGNNFNVLFDVDIPCYEPMHSSANGLLLLHRGGFTPGHLILCNPLTRDSVRLPSPPFFQDIRGESYGFGVSKISGQYKLVRLFHVPKLHTHRHTHGEQRMQYQYVCHLYTDANGWSEIASAGPFMHESDAKGAFLNGNLHWVAYASDGSALWISCFDLETECFSTFPPPPCHRNNVNCLNVSALSGYLSLCDNSTDNQIDFWLMKDYGEEKSWTKEFVIRKENYDIGGLVCPIKAFRNGDILMTVNDNNPLYFSKNTNTIYYAGLCGLKSCFCNAITYTPSCLPTFEDDGWDEKTDCSEDCFEETEESLGMGFGKNEGGCSYQGKEGCEQEQNTS